MSNAATSPTDSCGSIQNVADWADISATSEKTQTKQSTKWYKKQSTNGRRPRRRQFVDHFVDPCVEQVLNPVL